MKEWKVIFNLGLIVLSSVAESQIPAPPPPPPPPASVITSRADSLVNEGDIKGAVAEYCRLAVANPQNRRILYNYACVLSVDHQADSAFRYLYLAQEIDPMAAALTDPDLINLRDDARWREFEDHTISLINKKTPASIKDTGYARELWRMLCLDQYSFFETGLAVRKLGPGSPVVSALRRLQELKNAGNLRDLEVLISEKGSVRILDHPCITSFDESFRLNKIEICGLQVAPRVSPEEKKLILNYNQISVEVSYSDLNIKGNIYSLTL